MGTVATTRRSTVPPIGAVDVAPVTLEVLSSEDWRHIVPEWDACATAGAGNPFAQTPWFASAVWLQVAARSEMCLYTGRDAAGGLQVVAPLCLLRSRLPCLGLSTLRPLALHAQETSAVVVGAADRAAATSWIVDQILAAAYPAFDVLHFEAIDPGSVLFGALIDAAARQGLTVLTGTPMPNPVLTPIDGGGGRVLPGPSRRFRRNIRRAWRLARESGHEVTCGDVSWAWNEHASAIADIYRQRWGDAAPTDSYALSDPTCQGVLDLLFGRLDRYFRAHLFGAFVDGALAAYVICFRSGREVVLWNACMADRYRGLSVGMLLWDHCLNEIAGWSGVERINFGKGADRYKLDWSDASYAVCELALVRATGLRRRRALHHYGRLSVADAARRG